MFVSKESGRTLADTIEEMKKNGDGEKEKLDVVMMHDIPK